MGSCTGCYSEWACQTCGERCGTCDCDPGGCGRKLLDPMSRGDRSFGAYYYAFSPTGVSHIDNILAAVAYSGKKYHHTEYWSDEDPDYESCIEMIQRLAETSAKNWNARGGDDLHVALDKLSSGEDDGSGRILIEQALGLREG